MATKKFKVTASTDDATLAFIDTITDLPERGKVITKKRKGFPVVLVGTGNGECMYYEYTRSAEAPSDVKFIRDRIKKGEAPAAVVKNMGYKYYKRDDVESACGKKKTVRASASAKRSASKRSIKASKEDALERAKRNIYESYVNSDYGSDISFEDYFKNEDLHNVGLLYTTIGDDEYDFQVSADLIDPKVTVSVGDKVVYEDKYPSIDALANDLEGFDWDEWYSFYLHKLPKEYDEIIYGACKTMNKKIKASASAKRRASKRVVASTKKFTKKIVKASSVAKRRAKAIKSSIDSEYDTQILTEVDEYIESNYPIYVSTDWVEYESPDDWAVTLFADGSMVDSDFVFFLNEHNSYLYDRLNEAGLITATRSGNVVEGDDFTFQLFPYQNQWSAPTIRVDKTALASIGDDGTILKELNNVIADYTANYINALQDINYYIGGFLAEYDGNVSASTKRPIRAYIEEYPNWVYDWSDKKTEQNKRMYDKKLNEWYDVAEEMFPNFYELRGADRKNAIAEVNERIGFTMDDIFTSTNAVKCSNDFADADVQYKLYSYTADGEDVEVEYLDDYDEATVREKVDEIFNSNPDIDTIDVEKWTYMYSDDGTYEDYEYVETFERAEFEASGDIGASKSVKCSTGMKADDVQYVINEYLPSVPWIENVKDLGNGECEVTYNNSTVHVKFDLDDSMYVFDINGEGPYVYRSYEYIAPKIAEYIDSQEDITASTEVNADLQLNRYPDERKKYKWDKENSITDIRGYVQDIADGVVAKFPNLTYEISDEAITFTDENGTVAYVQPVDEIIPEKDDLENDVDELASAIQLDNDLEAMQKDFDAGWNATYDEDYATRSVQMSATDDELEPIMGDGIEEDMGYGFDSNGDPIDESMVDELERIANEVLEKSELAKIDPYVSVETDTFKYYASIPYVGEEFYIFFTFTQEGRWFIDNDMVDFSDMRGIDETEEFTYECDIHVKDGEVIEVLYNDMPDNYSADMIDLPALTEYIENLAAPVAMDIYNSITNI